MTSTKIHLQIKLGWIFSTVNRGRGMILEWFPQLFPISVVITYVVNPKGQSGFRPRPVVSFWWDMYRQVDIERQRLTCTERRRKGRGGGEQPEVCHPSNLNSNPYPTGDRVGSMTGCLSSPLSSICPHHLLAGHRGSISPAPTADNMHWGSSFPTSVKRMEWKQSHGRNLLRHRNVEWCPKLYSPCRGTPMDVLHYPDVAWTNSSWRLLHSQSQN